LGENLKSLSANGKEGETVSYFWKKKIKKQKDERNERGKGLHLWVKESGGENVA